MLRGITILSCLVATATTAAAQAPAQMPIQGYLTDAAGTPVDGATSMVLAIYATETGGTPLFTETQSVLVDAGYFTAYAGDVGTLDLTVFRDNTTLYMSVTVEGEELLPRSQLATVPYAAYAEHSGDATTVGGMSASALGAPAWSAITGVPAGLSDGDDDTTYSAGAGVTLTGTTFSVNTAGLQSRVTGVCAVGSSIRAIAAGGTVTCEADDSGPSYGAGTGLTLTGTTFAANTSVLQARVSGTCPAGSAISGVTAAGTVTCEVDDDTTYTAGNGITIVGTTVAVETTGRIGTYSPTTWDIQQGHWANIRFRIDGGGAAGRLEVSIDGGATYGTVCDDAFDQNNNAANVVCRSMGYSSGVLLDNGFVTDGTGTILIDNFNCPSWAGSIFDCRIPPFGVENCSHTEDVGVTCTL
ncbi:MAG: hypothetical protein JRH11_17425 [Deltaproteobacteria bacterium]|nr:hypothetical protein [Deltaproteobacteria bacterium]